MDIKLQYKYDNTQRLGNIKRRVSVTLTIPFIHTHYNSQVTPIIASKKGKQDCKVISIVSLCPKWCLLTRK